MRSTQVLLLFIGQLVGCADVLGLEESAPRSFGDGGGLTAQAGSSNGVNGIHIGWMSNGGPSNFFNTSRNGAILAGQELTNANGMRVTVSILDPADNQAATQAQRIRDAVGAGVNALAVDVIDPATIGPEIDRAVEAGVTVMTFDSDAPGSKRISYYGIDNEAAGETSAKILSRLMPAGGQIAIMNKESPPTAANYVARRDGFVRELANHPGLTVVVDLPCTDGPMGEATSQAGCSAGLESTMRDHPEITGWYLARGRALREAELSREAPNWTAKVKAGKFAVVGYDAVPEAIPNIEGGFVNATINQKYFSWGHEVIALLFDIVVSHRPVSPFTDSGFDVVCLNNVDEVAQAWTLQNFSTPIDKCSIGGSNWP